MFPVIMVTKKYHFLFTRDHKCFFKIQMWFWSAKIVKVQITLIPFQFPRSTAFPVNVVPSYNISLSSKVVMYAKILIIILNFPVLQASSPTFVTVMVLGKQWVNCVTVRRKAMSASLYVVLMFQFSQYFQSLSSKVCWPLPSEYVRQLGLLLSIGFG